MDTVIDALTAELGTRVLVDEKAREERRRDYWARSEIDAWQGHEVALPACAVIPESTADVAAAVRICREHRASVVARGEGSGVVGGVLADSESIVISTEKLTGLRHIDQHNLLATFGSGTNGKEAELAVNEHGFTIGHWPQSIDISSVGGWVSTRASGQYSTAYGNIEDVVYALEAVLPDGTIYRSRSTPRAAAGPDLRHILIGAEGTLGIVTEVTFSLRPMPEPGVRQAFHFDSMASGIDAIRSVMIPGWRPPVVRLYDASESRRHFKDTVEDGRCMLIFLHEGPPGHAELEAVAVSEICAAHNGVAADTAAVDRWFDHRNTVPSWSELFEQGILADTIEVATDWSHLAPLYDAVVERVEAVPGVMAMTAHSSHAYRSGANLYFTFVAQPGDAENFTSTYDACWNAAMSATAGVGAGLAHHHGVGRVRRDWMATELGEGGVSMLRDIKRALDPDNLMNPGVLIPDEA